MPSRAKRFQKSEHELSRNLRKGCTRCNLSALYSAGRLALTLNSPHFLLYCSYFILTYTLTTDFFSISGASGQYNALQMQYWVNETEQVYGLGIQYSYWNLRGLKIPVLTSEQGIGRGLQPLTAILNVEKAGGNTLTTYASQPIYLTSQNRYAAETDTGARMEGSEEGGCRRALHGERGRREEQ